jgi:para-nitrobenzyl esterase
MSWRKLTEAAPGAPVASVLRFAPIVDGYLLPAPVREIFAQGKQNDVVTLTGANTGELGGFGPPQPVTAESFQKQAHQRYGAEADEFLKLYPAATDAEAKLAQSQSVRVQALVSMYLWARERSKTAKTKVYEYLWDHALPGPDAGFFGAFHTSEVPYVLNTLYMSNRPFTDADRKIAAMMSSYWANFAATADPNGEGLVPWAPVNENPEVMEVGDKTGPITVAGNAAKFRFFETFLTK